MNGVELFHLGRRLMKLGEEAMPAAELGRFAVSVRSVLVDVIEHPDSAIGEIAERTGFPQSHVSSSVAALRDSGAMITAHDPTDRRRTLVRVTPDVEQRAAARLAAAQVDDAIAAAIDADDPQVVTEIVAMLEALTQWLLRPLVRDDRAGDLGGGGFDAMYAGTPPWDIGRPQEAFRRLADEGAITGRVLDVGCGTGEHVLIAAGLGLEATGVDSAPSAIAVAERKATERGIPARFEVLDIVDLDQLDATFDTVLDCGLFHTLSDDVVPRFVDSVATVLRPGGRYHLLCMSDAQPGHVGPLRASQAFIRDSFGDGWRIESIMPSVLETTMADRSPQAWLASILRV